MAGQTGGQSKGFVPGLVLGLVIGAFAGAVIPPLLSGPRLPPREGLPNPGTTLGDRDGPPQGSTPEQGQSEQGSLPPAEAPDETPEQPAPADDDSGGGG